MAHKKREKKELYTPDTEACVPYLTRVQSSVTPNIHVIRCHASLDTGSEGVKEMKERKKEKDTKKNKTARIFKGACPLKILAK